ncbi:hypothetical protein BDK51DRAFT_37042 [Blyttiomyces helicus]|uniref:Calycin-like protein n=1 Tax=Blyttiomyces helicus TaxID=388810 RepID=A0A4P9W782_9FUNG|nr:hypothetical protein BDK51DRAFT_37042 [Blyttiomyces helicus]|eukprot:RKO87253.1 hypothetical protein BDK51DRAFT_37042 [Blyttiomyces helicus]
MGLIINAVKTARAERKRKEQLPPQKILKTTSSGIVPNVAPPVSPGEGRELLLTFAKISPVLVLIDQVLAYSNFPSKTRTFYQIFCLLLFLFILSPAGELIWKPAVRKLVAPPAPPPAVVSGSGEKFWEGSAPGVKTIRAPLGSGNEAHPAFGTPETSGVVRASHVPDASYVIPGTGGGAIMAAGPVGGRAPAVSRAPKKTRMNFEGLWTFDTSRSDDYTDVLAAQGVSWVVRKVIAGLQLTYDVSIFTGPDGVEHIESINAKGAKQVFALDGVERQDTDQLFGVISCMAERDVEGRVRVFAKSAKNGWKNSATWTLESPTVMVRRMQFESKSLTKSFQMVFTRESAPIEDPDEPEPETIPPVFAAFTPSPAPRKINKPRKVKIAAPPRPNFSGFWTIDAPRSDDYSDVLAAQGVSWVVRKAIAVLKLTFDVTTTRDAAGVETIVSINAKGTKQTFVLDGRPREEADPLFGAIDVSAERTPEGNIRIVAASRKNGWKVCGFA